MLTIGSDPEFLFIKNNEIVPAIEILRDCDNCNRCDICTENICPGSISECGYCEGCELEITEDYNCSDCDPCYRCDRIRCDDCLSCNDCKMDIESIQLGTDGCSDVGELRPEYSNDPLSHKNNIYKLIKQIPEGDYKVIAGTIHNYEPLGGHIHFGWKKKPLLTRDDLLNKKEEKLSNYLSFYCGILLRKIEREKDIVHRGLREEGYGWFGDYRVKHYGVEWRMPASWLVSREIATASLCLSYVVANEYKSQKIKVTNERYFSLLKHSTTQLINRIEKMKIYKSYSREIEPLFQMVINKEHWDPTVDIREQW